jgi:hypothetical protein
MDLDRGGSLQVRVRHANGAPSAGHSVAVHGGDRRTMNAETDADGSATFTQLPAGQYTALSTIAGKQRSFAGELHETVELGEGDHRTVELTIPESVPRSARLVLDDGASCSSWRARNPYGTERAWTDVHADGTIPLDIQHVHAIEIEHESTRRWTFDIPADARDGYVLRVSQQGPALRGVLRDWSGARLLSRVAVIAYARSTRGTDGSVANACITDAEGRFELMGLDPVPHDLVFQYGEDPMSWDQSIDGYSFVLTEPPAVAPRELEIRLPRQRSHGATSLAERVLTGTVRSAGLPAAGITVYVLSLVGQPDGELRITSQSASCQTDPAGLWRVRVPVAERYSASFFSSTTKQRWPSQEWTSSSAGDAETRDFDLE